MGIVADAEALLKTGATATCCGSRNARMSGHVLRRFFILHVAPESLRPVGTGAAE